MTTLVADSLVFARRNIAHIRQVPEKLFDVTLQPIMFTLLFAYVFGGVIAIHDGSYREYLIGGVMVQSLAFGIMGPASAIATDLREGVVDRFRTLPTVTGAYLTGHVLAELAAILIAIAILSLSGLIVGWRIHSDLPHALAGYALLTYFAFAMIWLGTWLGVTVRTPDAAQGLVFLVMFPMTFLASTFVPLGGLSPTLATIASWNPISAITAAVRELFGNPTGMPADPAWPLQHPVIAALGWSTLVLLIAVPLALRGFRRRTAG
ncbi:MAG: ABC transporter permease [Deltaproteobacteria bacterium]|nr:ABC transporter permease [Deltaproteobacteria bacterium]